MKKKKTGDFYGEPIQRGLLHGKMGVPAGEKIPISKLRVLIAALKKKKNRAPADIKKLREAIFALNAKTKFGK